MQRVLVLVACFVAALAVGGCNETKTSDAGSETSESKPKKKKAIGKLPPVEQTLPAVDEGRLVVSVPKDWHVPTNPGKALVRASKSRELKYPIVLVYVEEFKKLDDVSTDNVEDFVDLRTEEFKQQKIKLPEPVEALTAGNFRGAKYLRLVKTTQGSQLEKLCVETVVDNRLYRVELHAYRGALDDNLRKVAYAVAAGLTFPKAAPRGEAADESSAEEPEEDKPDEKKAKE